MNKYAAEKIAQEYYALGLQYALKNAGLMKTANDVYDTTKDMAYADGMKALNGGGYLNTIPYHHPTVRDLASKYNLSRNTASGVHNAAERHARGVAELGNLIGVSSPRVPYRD